MYGLPANGVPAPAFCRLLTTQAEEAGMPSRAKLSVVPKVLGKVAEQLQSPTESPVRGLPSTAAIFGHPIHPMLIPYPVAFLTTALATDLAAARTGDAFWSRASSLLLGAGVVTGLAAGAVGAIDYFTIRRAREKTVGKLHAYGNPVALGLAAASLALRPGSGRPPGGAAVALTAAMTAVLGITAWAGAELSYRHMVGVAGHGDQHTHREKRYVA